MGTQNALPKITHVQDFGIDHRKKTPTNNEICYGFSKLFNKVGHTF